MQSAILFWTSVVAVSMLVSYVLLSFIEHVSHGVFMHKPTWFTRRSPYFKAILDEHRTFHHGECFPGSRFDHAEGDCLHINIRLPVLWGQMASCWIWGTLYVIGFILGVGSTAGQVVLLFSAIFQTMLMLHHMTWNLIHIQMHTEKEKRHNWFNNSAVCLYLARYHYVHHVHWRYNFCVVCPLADWLMGTYKAPDAKDLANLQKLGFYRGA